MKLGTIESVWRYPVKSMRGEEVNDIYVAYTGLMGDRIYAIASSTAVPEFPWHTNREQEEFVLYQPRFKKPENTLKPADLEATYAEMLNPPYPLADDFAVDVELPSGEILDIDDPLFLDGLRGESDGNLTLRYTQKNMVDSNPLSLFSLQTLDQLSLETGMTLDKRRFRANFNVNWDTGGGFYENELLNKKLRIGDALEIMILDPIPRCKSITVDPDTAETSPKLLRHIARKHDGNAAVCAAVLREGTVKSGDEIHLVDA